MMMPPVVSATDQKQPRCYQLDKNNLEIPLSESTSSESKVLPEDFDIAEKFRMVINANYRWESLSQHAWSTSHFTIVRTSLLWYSLSEHLWTSTLNILFEHSPLNDRCSSFYGFYINPYKWIPLNLRNCKSVLNDLVCIGTPTNKHMHVIDTSLKRCWTSQQHHKHSRNF